MKKIISIIISLVIYLYMYSFLPVYGVVYNNWEDMYNEYGEETEGLVLADMGNTDSFIAYYNILNGVDYSKLNQQEKEAYESYCNYLIKKMGEQGTTYTSQISDLQKKIPGNENSSGNNGGNTNPLPAPEKSTEENLKRLYTKLDESASGNLIYKPDLVDMTIWTEYYNLFLETNAKDIDSKYLTKYIDFLDLLSQNSEITYKSNEAHRIQLESEIKELEESGQNLSDKQKEKISKIKKRLTEAKEMAKAEEESGNLEEIEEEEPNDKIFKWPDLIDTENEQDPTLEEMIEGGDEFLEAGTEEKIDQSKLSKLTGNIYNILLEIGVGLSVIIGLILGIKFMISGVEEKAQVKKMLLVYVIGCIIVFGSFGIWKIGVEIAQSVISEGSSNSENSDESQGGTTEENGGETGGENGSGTGSGTGGGATDNTKPPTSVKLDKTEIELNVGETLTLKATIKPTDATYKKITWVSSNNDVATVNRDGKVTAIKKGTAVITAKTVNGITAKCKVKVKDEVIKKIDGKQVTLPVGDKVYFLDTQFVYEGYPVGSDCIILESNGKYGMIDTATGHNDRVMKYLNELNIKELEFLLITHSHTDHTGGYDKIKKKIKIKNMYIKDRNKYLSSIRNLVGEAKKLGTRVHYTQEDNIIKLGNFTLKLFNTQDMIKGREDVNENANSVTALTTVNNKTIYFAGDIGNYSGVNAENMAANLVQSTLKSIGKSKIDVYKVAHHSYNTNNSEYALKKLNPVNSITTNGYMRPKTSEATKRIKSYVDKNGGKMFYTYSGTVVVNVSPSGELKIRQLPNYY